MRRSAVVLLIASLFLLAGCSTDLVGSASPDSDVADPHASTTTESYPDFPQQSYTFVLTITCYCYNPGEPIMVTVIDREIVDAFWLESGTGHEAGDPLENVTPVSIQHIIDAANNTEAFEVEVDWPTGQDYPSRVYVDQTNTTADEEVAYTIADVVLTG